MIVIVPLLPNKIAACLETEYLNAATNALFVERCQLITPVSPGVWTHTVSNCPDNIGNSLGKRILQEKIIASFFSVYAKGTFVIIYYTKKHQSCKSSNPVMHN